MSDSNHTLETKAATETFDDARRWRYGVDSAKASAAGLAALASTIDLRKLYDPKTGLAKPIALESDDPIAELRGAIHCGDDTMRSMQLMLVELVGLTDSEEARAREYLFASLTDHELARAALWRRDEVVIPGNERASTSILRGRASPFERLSASGVTLLSGDQHELPARPLAGVDAPPANLSHVLERTPLALERLAFTVELALQIGTGYAGSLKVAPGGPDPFYSPDAVKDEIRNLVWCADWISGRAPFPSIARRFAYFDPLYEFNAIRELVEALELWVNTRSDLERPSEIMRHVEGVGGLSMRNAVELAFTARIIGAIRRGEVAPWDIDTSDALKVLDTI